MKYKGNFKENKGNFKENKGNKGVLGIKGKIKEIKETVDTLTMSPVLCINMCMCTDGHDNKSKKR